MQTNTTDDTSPLAVAILFIEQSGGRLEIDSGVPGTTVRARLPLMERSA
jgi:hypothetical protein